MDLSPPHGSRLHYHNVTKNFLRAFSSFRDVFLSTWTLKDVQSLVETLKCTRARDALCVFKLFKRLGYEQDFVMFCVFAFFEKFDVSASCGTYTAVIQLALAHNVLIPACFQMPRPPVDFNELLSESFLESIYLGRSGIVRSMVTDVKRAAAVGIVWNAIVKEHCRRTRLGFFQKQPLFMNRELPYFGVMTETNGNVYIREAVDAMHRIRPRLPSNTFYVDRHSVRFSRTERLALAYKWLLHPCCGDWLQDGMIHGVVIYSVSGMLWYLKKCLEVEYGATSFEDCLQGIGGGGHADWVLF